MDARPRRPLRTAIALPIFMTCALALLVLRSDPAAAADTASSSLGTFSGTTAAMVDGNLATSWKSFGTPSTGDWVRIDKGAVVPMSRVDLYMTDAASPGDRIVVGVIEISSNGTTWTAIGTFSNVDEVHVPAPAGTTARYARARPTAGQSAWLVVRELSTAATGVPPAPPAQPTSGPGGSNYPHAGYTVTPGGTGNDAWYVFEPATPKPASAPVAVMLHGFGEFTGRDAMAGFIEHTVRKGYVVVYPRWQTDVLNPGDIGGRMTAARNGITGGLAWLQASATRVQPQLNKVNYFGWSYGGIIVTNLANRYGTLGLPVPRSLMLVEPHDGFSEGDLDDALSGIPATTILTCYVSDNIRPADPIGCKTIFPLIGHIANDRKDYVTFHDDLRGYPALVASHQSVCSLPTVAPANGACGTPPDQTRTDGVDHFVFWKSWVAQQTCANDAVDCAYAVNDTPAHRNRGLWSDGIAVRPLQIGDAP
jgi:pimeloyl-ACP methyl ester carboxylesterase